MAHELLGSAGIPRGYTCTRIRLVGQIEQRDGYAPDAAAEVELVICNWCGSVVLSGDALDTVWQHDRWHDDQEQASNA